MLYDFIASVPAKLLNIINTRIMPPHRCNISFWSECR